MKLSIDRELDWFRNLAGGFSVFSGYDGYEIAQVELAKGSEEKEPICEEKRRDDRYATLMVSKNGKQMTMKLIRPKETVEQILGSRMEGAHPVKELPQMEDTQIQVEGAEKQGWSADDIQNFTETVGDTNSIHQGEQAIVPGLLMLETMLLECEKQEMVCKKIKMRFYKPVFASQPVWTTWEGMEITARTKEEDVCWKMWLS